MKIRHKILLLTNDLKRGGKERQICLLLNSLASNSLFDFTILLYNNIIEYNIHDIKGIKIKCNDKGGGIFRYFLFLEREIRKIKPDVIHGWEGGVTFYANIINCFIYLRKYKIADGSLRFAKRFRFFSIDYFIIKLNSLLSNKVISNSKAGLKAARLKQNNKNIVIHNGILPLFYKAKENKTSNVFSIGQVASFSKPKDYKTLIKTSLKILEAGIVMFIYLIGDGPEKLYIQNMVPDKYRKYFIFTGMVDNVEDYISKFDVGILLTKNNHSEGLSNSIMEYMAAGLPVICTNTGGNSELVKEGINGFLINHEDEEMLYDKIMFFYFDKITVEKMGQDGRKILVNNFSITSMAKEYEQLYTKMIN